MFKAGETKSLLATLRQVDHANVFQADRTDARRHIQAGRAFHTDRLQGDGFVKPADQHVGAQTDADIGLYTGAGIFSFDGARAPSEVGANTAQASLPLPV